MGFVDISPLSCRGNQSLGNSRMSGPITWVTGLVYQAQGKYEKAAAHFTHLLQNEDSLSSLGSDGVTYDEGEYQAAWACLGLTPKSSSDLTLDPKLALQRSEQMLLQQCFCRMRRSFKSYSKALYELVKFGPQTRELTIGKPFKQLSQRSYIELLWGKHHDFLISNLQYEGILMHAEKNLEDALTNLWSFVSPVIVSSPSIVSDADNSILKAKACLKLSNWLKQIYSDSRLDGIIIKIRSDFDMANSSSPSRGGPSFVDEILSSKPPLGSIIEEIVGTATKLSLLHLCPTMGQTLDFLRLLVYLVRPENLF
ncbi:hypothetical protein M0R45_001823 [Rubus argutus]|uniref:Uncharacterized protein n=1 Tax=Rubus argutus TaxID=59490 RepID=A0AAW1VJK1_RUBAR